MPYNTDIGQMLDADPFELAGSIFGAVFAGVAIGDQTAYGRVRKQLRARFGNPRWSDPHSGVYDAVALQTTLVWERALVATRAHSGVLVLLPRGTRLLAAPDPVAALREFL
ncbi:hypothetical protein [Kribbella sindirgiensis]|uniref:Uncharacterized protein n=1 Tax=Kribbella sindirgiensis TaxID=1124744 RepID=A0A4R0I0K6_9ACTN|nr:hypothetical protein [Kribbella sindirgiensis]TCC20646.1 hypothetical protein E0H50_37120 [Kribbella sindirgiensis]